MVHVIRHAQQLNGRRRLTVHHNVVTLPEKLLVLERRLWNSSAVLPILPLGPVLPKVDTVPQLLGAERTVSEDDGVVLLSLSEKEAIGSLITQTGQLVRIHVGYLVRRWPTPVPTPPWLCRSLIVIVNIPSAKFLIVALQYHFETVAPRIAAGSMFVSEIVKHETEPDFTKGEEPFPDDVRLNVIDLGNTIAIHEVQKLDLDVDTVGVLIVVGHFDPGVMSRTKFGKGRDQRDPVGDGDESLEIVGL